MKAKNKGGILLISIFVIIIAVIVVIAVSLRENPIKTAIREDKGVLKTLFVLENNNQVLFTDVLMYYPPSKRGALLNIQGNTGSIFRSLDRADRIDAIYSEKGIDVYKSEIEALIGQPIPFYVLMSLDEFSELTDLLGGMSVFIPSSVDVKGEDGTRWLLPSGAINLDGDKIKTYLMYTKSDENTRDVDDRRQNVVLAFFNAVSKNMRIFQRRSTFQEISKRFQSNLSYSNLQQLFYEVSQIDAERLVPQTVDGMERTVGGKTLVFPTRDGIFIKEVVSHEISKLLADGGQNIRSNYSLQILNGTASQGLATRTANLLKSANYDVLEAGNADSNEYEKTVILNHIGKEDVAKLLGDFIKCDNIQEDNNTENPADFTIILGKDFDGRYVR